MKIFLTVAGFFLLNPGFLYSQNQIVSTRLTDVSGKLPQEQAELIYKTLKIYPCGTQAAFSFIKNGEISYWGATRKNDTVFYIDNRHNVFETGSITKVFTSTLLAHLVLNGNVNPDDKISNYIESVSDSVTISFKQLANHTSGLPRMPSNFSEAVPFSPANPYKNYNKKMLNAYLSEDLNLMYEPGTKMEYSNLGAGLLGYILTEIAGSDYQELLRAHILSKYNMASTATNREEVIQKLVPGLSAGGEKTPNWDFSVLVGAGGILSSVKDLSKFALAQFNDSNKELALTREKTFEAGENLDLGMGWHIIRTKTEDEWFWHNGGTGGYTSSMALDIRKKNGIIILSNVSAFHPDSNKIDELCFLLLKALGE